jgi:hypothetical protein
VSDRYQPAGYEVKHCSPLLVNAILAMAAVRLHHKVFIHSGAFSSILANRSSCSYSQICRIRTLAVL